MREYFLFTYWAKYVQLIVQPISQLTHLTGVRSALYFIHIQITFIVTQGDN